MLMCRHQPHRVIRDIKAPKYSNKTVRINVDKVSPKIEHYLIRFSDGSPKKEFGWFYMSGKVIRRHRVVPNGRGRVYEVPLNKREAFIEDKDCVHNWK